jgi:hypothetical protein
MTLAKKRCDLDLISFSVLALRFLPSFPNSKFYHLFWRSRIRFGLLFLLHWIGIVDRLVHSHSLRPNCPGTWAIRRHFIASWPPRRQHSCRGGMKIASLLKMDTSTRAVAMFRSGAQGYVFSLSGFPDTGIDSVADRFYRQVVALHRHHRDSRAVSGGGLCTCEEKGTEGPATPLISPSMSCNLFPTRKSPH